MNGLSAVLGFEVCQLYDLVQNKKWEEAIELQKRLLPVDFLVIITAIWELQDTYLPILITEILIRFMFFSFSEN